MLSCSGIKRERLASERSAHAALFCGTSEIRFLTKPECKEMLAEQYVEKRNSLFYKKK